MSISFIFFVCGFIGRKKVVTIITYAGKNIELYFTNSNKDEVIDFANQIIQAINEFFLNKFSKIDRGLPIEPQLEQIQFLRNKEIITEQHYETLKNQLLGRENAVSIGFKN